MQKIKYGSVCSGIEAASVAWQQFGWEASWFSEIDAFPSAVLNHHWPHVQNLGDMTKIRDRIAFGEVEAPDVLVGGTPCQAFSVAGARKSLDDDRGQLTLEYVRLANAIDEKRKEPCIVVWENVPGVLNTKDNAFGCFLGALAGESGELKPSGGRWSNAGCVFGPQRAIAWRILDAQYFGVAQRRRRVFVVASARKGFNPSKVLFEWEGMRRDIAPSRNAGQEITGSAGKSPYLASGKPAIGTLMANAGTKLWLGNQEAFSGDYAIIHPASNTTVIHGTQDPITQDNQAFPIGRNNGQENAVFTCATKQQSMTCENNLASTLGANDHKEPQAVVHCLQGNIIDRESKQNGSGISEECSHTLNTQDRHAVAYAFDSLSSNSMKSPNPNSGCREVDLGKTLDTTDPNPSKNQGGIGILQYQAYGIQGNMIGRSDTAGPQGSGVSDDISFTLTTGDRHGVYCGTQNDACRDVGLEISPTLRAGNGGGAVNPVANTSAVRRLTPIEYERLQGFPDNHTQIPYRNKSAELCPDGPRYAACGNSMAVPVMAWIGNRIDEILKNESI